MMLAGVPVIDGHGERRVEPVDGLFELVALVPLEGLERKDVKGVPGWVAQQGGEDRSVVDQRLAAGGGRGDDDVATRENPVDALGLVTVESVDSGGLDYLRHLDREPADVVGVAGWVGRDVLFVDDGIAEDAVLEIVQEGSHRGPLGLAVYGTDHVLGVAVARAA